MFCTVNLNLRNWIINGIIEDHHTYVYTYTVYIIHNSHDQTFLIQALLTVQSCKLNKNELIRRDIIEMVCKINSILPNISINIGNYNNIISCDS